MSVVGWLGIISSLLMMATLYLTLTYIKPFLTLVGEGFCVYKFKRPRSGELFIKTLKIRIKALGDRDKQLKDPVQSYMGSHVKRDALPNISTIGLSFKHLLECYL